MNQAAVMRLREIAAERRRLDEEEERLLEALDNAGPAPSAPAAGKNICVKEAAELVGRSQRTVYRWLRENPGLGFQIDVSGEWIVDARALVHLVSTQRSHGERGGKSGDHVHRK